MTDPAVIDALAAKIAGVETTGQVDPYTAVGPRTKTGDRAYGKYQVMGKNVPVWTREALGKPLTPEAFRKNPDAQERTVKHVLGKLHDQYGNEQDVASVWHSGVPLARAKAEGRADANITTAAYTERVAPSESPSTEVKVKLPDGTTINLGANPTPELRAQVKQKILAKFPELGGSVTTTPVRPDVTTKGTFGPQESIQPEPTPSAQPFGRQLATGVGAGVGALAGGAIPGFGEVGGPLVGAAAGGGAAGTLYDWATGRPITGESAATDIVESGGYEAGGGAALRGTGAAIRAVGKTRFGSKIGQAVEALIPNIMQRAGRTEEVFAKIGAPDAEEVSRIYAQVDQLAGEQPVVPVGRLREAIAEIHGEVAGTPRTGPRGMARVEAGLPEVTPEVAEAIDAASRGDAITFKQARIIESEFGKQAYRTRSGTSPTPAQYYAKKLHRAVGEDMGDFFASDAGTEVGPALQAAKDQYKLKLADMRLREVYKRATTQRGGFDAPKFARGLAREQEQLQKLLPPERFNELMTLKSEFDRAAPKTAVDRTILDEYGRSAISRLVGVAAVGYPLYEYRQGGMEGLTTALGHEAMIGGAAASALTPFGQRALRGLLPQMGRVGTPASWWSQPHPHEAP